MGQGYGSFGGLDRFYITTCFPCVICFAWLCFGQYQEEYVVHVHSWRCSSTLRCICRFCSWLCFFGPPLESRPDGLSDTCRVVGDKKSKQFLGSIPRSPWLVHDGVLVIGGTRSTTTPVFRGSVLRVLQVRGVFSPLVLLVLGVRAARSSALNMHIVLGVWSTKTSGTPCRNSHACFSQKTFTS